MGKTVSDPGLSLCAEQVFDFVQEMGDLKLGPLMDQCHPAQLFLRLDL